MLKLPTILKAEMDRLGLSQRELAELAGVPQQTVSAIFRGLRTPTAVTLGKILAALDRPWGWLDRQGLDPRGGKTRKARAG